MKGIIELTDFYRPLQKTIYDRLVNIGHFDIIPVEELPKTEPEAANYLRRSYYKVSLVYGHSKIKYPQLAIEINGAALVFTHPTKPYRWERISNDQRGLVCIFTADFVNNLAQLDDFAVFKNEMYSVIPLDDALAATIDNLFKGMLEEYNGHYRRKYDLLRHMLLEILYRGEKTVPDAALLPGGYTATERITDLFFELLERQFPITAISQRINYPTPASFSTVMNIHVNHLNKALKRHTGKSTSTLMAERIILEAKNLLAATGWSIKEISNALGFENANYFSSNFKRHVGLSPNKFRAGLD